MIMEFIELLTNKYNQMICISDEVENIIKKSNVKNASVLVQTMHTTTGVMMNERLECLESDIESYLEDLVPETRNYAHARMLDSYGSTAGNPTGHLKSMLVGNHCHLIVNDGKIMKGGAQEIYFMEFDGPAQRKIMVQISSYDKI